MSHFVYFTELYRHRNMWSIPVLFLLVTIADAIGNNALCPKGCRCASSDNYLSINCSHNSSNIDGEELYRQLNSLLSSEHFSERLTSLTITNTKLARVPASVCHLLNLTFLLIEHNRITELPDNCFTKLTKLVTLSLSSNLIVNLQDGLFDGLQSLMTLNLDYNQIAFIGLRVFSNASDLTSLHRLSIMYNKLTSLEPWWYYRCIHGSETSPVFVDIRNNLISNFTNELHLNFRCGMRQPFGLLVLSVNPIYHIMNILQGWKIADVDKLSCLENNRSSRPLMKIYVRGYHYVCDCIDYPIYAYFKTQPSRISITEEVFCDRDYFMSKFLQGVPANTIPLSEFVCELSDHCPSSCRCVYRPANATLHVYCSSANISSLPLHLPPLPKSYVKYKLDFSNNKLLRRLEHRPYFVNTSILDVSNCSLSEINMEVLQDVSGFKTINLRGNTLQSFVRQVNAMNISAQLLLGLNPWKCSCDNSWMIKWFRLLSSQISDPGDIICGSPARMYGRSVLRATEYDFCVDPVTRTLKLSLSSTLSAVALLLLIGFAVYRLRVRLYRRWKFHPFDRDECVGEDMDYDVFLCCSAQDDRPHGRRILERIEANGYRVCYHERDFRPGQLITDNMGHAIERSKRTVCLISSNFLGR